MVTCIDVIAAGSQVIFRVRRPFYFINSSIYVEDGEGNTIGEVQQRWHLWQRNYDLYIDRKQYATINSGLWAWEFLLKDKDGGQTPVPTPFSPPTHQKTQCVTEVNRVCYYAM